MKSIWCRHRAHLSFVPFLHWRTTVAVSTPRSILTSWTWARLSKGCLSSQSPRNPLFYQFVAFLKVVFQFLDLLVDFGLQLPLCILHSVKLIVFAWSDSFFALVYAFEFSTFPWYPRFESWSRTKKCTNTRTTHLKRLRWVILTVYSHHELTIFFSFSI